MKGLCLLLATAACLAVSAARGQFFYTWTGGGIDSNWSTSANWGGATPVSRVDTTLVFTGSTTSAASNNLASPFQLNRLVFSELTGGFTVAGSPLRFEEWTSSLPATIEQNGTFGATIESLILVASSSLTFGGTGAGDLRLLANFYNAGRLLRITRAADSLTTFDGGLTNDGTVQIASGTTRIRGLQNIGGIAVGPQGKLVLSDTSASYTLGAESQLVGATGSSISLEGVTLNIRSALTPIATSGTFALRGGSLTGTTNFNLDFANGTFLWSGGEIEGSANNFTTIFLGNGKLSGAETKTVGRTLIFSGGSLSWEEGDLAVTSDATLNLDRTHLAITGSAGNLNTTGTGTRLRLYSGTLTKDNDTVTEIRTGVLADAGSRISSSGGTLRFTQSGSYGAAFTASNGTTIEFSGGTQTLEATASISGAGNATMRVASGTLSIDSTIPLQIGLVLEDGAALGGTAASLDFHSTGASAFAWNGGTIFGPNFSHMGVFSPTTISGTASKTVDRRNLSLAGGEWSGGDVNLLNGSVLAISGSMAVTGDNALARSGASGHLWNSGFLHKTIGTGTTTLAVPMLNSGSIRIDSGTLLLTGGGTSSGLLAVNSLGTIDFAGGTFQLTGNDPLSAFVTGTSRGEFRITGGQVNINAASAFAQNAVFTLASSGTLGGGSPNYAMMGTRFNWNGGVITGTTNSSLYISPFTFISGTDTKTLDRRSITLSGGSWSDGDIQLINGSNVMNSGMFTVTTDSALTRSGTASRLENYGFFNKTTTTGTTTLNVALLNTGTIRAGSGTILLSGGGTSSGLLTASSVGAIEFASGTYQLYGGTPLSGFTSAGNASTFLISGGQVNINDTGATINQGARLTLADGATLGGAATDFGISGHMTWAGGRITGTNNSLVRVDTISITGPAGKNLDRRSLVASGSWSGGDIALTNGALLTTGNLLVTSDNSLTRSGTFSRLENTGLFQKTTATGTTTLALPIFNSGTLRAATGAILLTGGGTSSGMFSTGINGSLIFQSGTYQLFGDAFVGDVAFGANSGSFRIDSGLVNINTDSALINQNARLFLAESGTLGGLAQTFTIGGRSLEWSGGVITGANGSTVTNLGQTHLSGTATKTLDRRSLVGSGTWSGGDIALVNGANLTTGTMSVTTDNSLTRTGTFSRLETTGLFQKIASTGTTTLALPILNSGTLRAGTGTLLLTAGGTSMGMFTTGSTGSLQFQGGTYQLSGDAFQGDASFGPNAGTFHINSGRVNINSEAAQINQNARLFLHESGTLGGSAQNFTIAGRSFEWTGGVLTGTFGSTATVTPLALLSGTATKTLANRSLAVSGSWTGGDIVANAATLTTGTLTATSDNTISGSSARLQVDTQFLKNGTSGTTAIAAAIQGGGSFRAQTGTILLTGGGTTYGQFLTGPAGSVEFGGGTFLLNGMDALSSASTGGNFLIRNGRVNIGMEGATLARNATLTLADSGTLGGFVNYTISGSSFQWQGGVISGTFFNTTTVERALISGTATKTIDRRAVMASGTWSGGDIALTNNGRLGMGPLTITSDNAVTITNGGGVTVTGSAVKTASTGTTRIDGPVNISGGSLTAETGTILLANGGTSFGNLFLTRAGGAIEFAGGTFTAGFQGFSAASGGTFLISGGVMNASGGMVNQNSTLILRSGTLNGPSFLAISGSRFQWEGGTILGNPGETLLVQPGAILSGGSKTLGGRNLSLSGTWTGGDIALLNAGRLTVGDLAVQSDAKITSTDSTGSLLINGHFTKNTTTGTSTLGAGFRNLGTISVQSGVLRFTQSGTNEAGIMIGNGGTLDVDAHLFGAGTMNVEAGGTLMGSGTIQGAVTVSGTLAPGNSPGTLAFDSTLLMDDNSTYAFELGAYADDASGGLAGTDWDLLAFSGEAGLTFDAGSMLFLNFTGIENPDSPGAFWNGETDRMWLIADLAEGALNYANLSVANADWDTGSFRLTNVGNDLYLQFTAVPEPSSAALILLALGLALRRRNRTSDNLLP